MLSPYRIPPSSKTDHTRNQNTTNTKLDEVEMTLNDPRMTSNEPVKENKLKCAAKIEINEKNLDEILDNNHL